MFPTYDSNLQADALAAQDHRWMVVNRLIGGASRHSPFIHTDISIGPEWLERLLHA
jgi:hypothetical protein